MRLSFLKFLPCIAAAIFLHSCKDEDVTPSPNILLIIADDMGLDATPCYDAGAAKPDMPTLESLCSNGLVFENFWVDPECSPTRATILTGKYGYRTGVLAAEINNEIPLSETSIQNF